MPGSHVGEAHLCVPWGRGWHQQELLLHWLQHGAEQETGVSEPGHCSRLGGSLT